MDFDIRRAVLADAEATAHCHLLCWREAYAGIVELYAIYVRQAWWDKGLGRRLMEDPRLGLPEIRMVR